MNIRGAALVAAAALALAGCGGEDGNTASKGKIAWGKADLAQQLRDEVGLPETTKVACKAGLPAEEGAKTTCTASAEGESAKYNVVVEPAGETGAVAPVFTGEGGAPAMEQDYPAEDEMPAETSEGVPEEDEYDEPKPDAEEEGSMLSYGKPGVGERWTVTVAKPRVIPSDESSRMLCANSASFVVVDLTWKNTSKETLSPGEEMATPDFTGLKEGLCEAGEQGDGDAEYSSVLPGRQVTVRRVVGLPSGEKPKDIAVTLGQYTWAP